MGAVMIDQLEAGFCDVQNMFEPATGKRIEAVSRGGERFEQCRVSLQKLQRELSQRQVGDFAFGQRSQFGKHRPGIEAGVIVEIGLAEPVGLVGLANFADLSDVDAWPILGVFGVSPADLVEAAHLKFTFAAGEQLGFRPDGHGNSPAEIAEFEFKKGPRIPGGSRSLLDQECEEVGGGLMRLQLMQRHQDWFGFGHDIPRGYGMMLPTVEEMAR